MKAFVLLLFVVLLPSCSHHARTEVFPICSNGQITITAINSDMYGVDETIEILVDGHRIGIAQVTSTNWEALARAMRGEK